MMEVIGMAAGFLTTVGSLPQIYRVVRTGSAHDLSLGMYLMVVPGVALWLVYGLMDGSVSLIFWNTAATLFNGSLLVLKALDLRGMLP